MDSFRIIERNEIYNKTNDKIKKFSIICLFGLVAISSTCCNCLDNLELIKQACDKELDFNSIKEFEDFLKVFKTTSEEQLKSSKVTKDCQTDRVAILELEKLITKQDVCDSYKIDDLISYHKKYFKPTKFLGLSKPITNKFFTKYAIQVAYTCKKNLLANLELAREELKARNKTFEEARDKVYSEEPIIKSNIKLIEEQPDVPTGSNVRPQDEAELTMGEYREALVKLQKPEDILTFEVDDCKSSKDNNNRKHETIISKDKVQIFFKPAMMCHQLNRYYAGSILSIARLANHGYVAWDEELDGDIANEPSIRDWVIAVQVCEPMLYMNTKEFKDDFAIIDTCSDKVAAIEMMVYENDDLDELDTNLLDRLIPKSRATRANAQKLMRSAYKRMAKMDLMKQLKSGAKKKSIFSKSISMLTNNNGNNIINNNEFSQSTISDPLMKAKSLSKFTIQLTGDMSAASNTIESLSSSKKAQNNIEKDLTDDQSYEVLKNFIDEKNSNRKSEKSDNNIDAPVAFIDPVSTLATTLTVMAIMLSFEWLFFIVMTLAARICTHFHFNFGNILTFPPKFLSWSDADFATYNERMEKMDEDDFFDYDELNEDEKHQRDLLNKLFGKPPPMLYRE